jgi:hypothetical protein
MAISYQGGIEAQSARPVSVDRPSQTAKVRKQRSRSDVHPGEVPDRFFPQGTGEGVSIDSVLPAVVLRQVLHEIQLRVGRAEEHRLLGTLTNVRFPGVQGEDPANRRNDSNNGSLTKPPRSAVTICFCATTGRSIKSA